MHIFCSWYLFRGLQQGSSCTLKSKTHFPDFRYNFSYPPEKTAQTSTVSLLCISSIQLECCCKENYLINFFNISVSLGVFPCCLFPLSIASNTSCSLHLQGCSLVIPTFFISYFLYDNSYFQISSQCQPSINTCQIFRQAGNVLFLLLGRNPPESNLPN